MRSSSFSSRMADSVGKGLAPFHIEKGLVPFRHRISITCLRLTFGAIWAWNTLLLARHLTTNTSSLYVRQVVTSSQQAGQYISQWSDFWQQVATQHPVGFILICIVSMSFVACGLFFGLLTNLTCSIGSLLALFFWSTQLVSLMPTGVQASDIGMLLVFLLAFLGFIISNAGQTFGVDRMLKNGMGYWAFLASGRRDIGKGYPNTLNLASDYEQVQWQKVEFPAEVSKATSVETPTEDTQTLHETGIL